MSELPAFKLKSTVYKGDLAGITEVISKYMFEFYLYVRVPDVIMRNKFVLTDLEEIGEHENYVCPIKYVEFIGGPWYRITSSALNVHPGQHIYRMHMVNTVTDDVTSVLFSYILQDDHPDKPYIYMDPDKRGACCCNVTSENRVS